MYMQPKPTESLAKIERMDEAEKLEVYTLYEQTLAAQARMEEEAAAFKGLRTRLEDKRVPYTNTEAALSVKEYLDHTIDAARKLKKRPWAKKTAIAVGATVAIATAVGGLAYLLYDTPPAPVTPRETAVVRQDHKLQEMKDKATLARLYDGFDQDCNRYVTLGEFLDLSKKITGVDLAQRWSIKHDHQMDQIIRFYNDLDEVSNTTAKGKGAVYVDGRSINSSSLITMTRETAEKFAEKLPEGHCELFR